MYTEKSKAGDFFDVSAIEGKRPEAVIVLWWRRPYIFNIFKRAGVKLRSSMNGWIF